MKAESGQAAAVTATAAMSACCELQRALANSRTTFLKTRLRSKKLSVLMGRTFSSNLSEIRARAQKWKRTTTKNRTGPRLIAGLEGNDELCVVESHQPLTGSFQSGQEEGGRTHTALCLHHRFVMVIYHPSTVRRFCQ